MDFSETLYWRISRKMFMAFRLMSKSDTRNVYCTLQWTQRPNCVSASIFSVSVKFGSKNIWNCEKLRIYFMPETFFPLNQWVFDVTKQKRVKRIKIVDLCLHITCVLVYFYCPLSSWTTNKNEVGITSGTYAEAERCLWGFDGENWRKGNTWAT